MSKNKKRLICAIIAGVQPFRDYFKTRWQRFYHESCPAGRWHFAIDIILAAAVLGLIIFNAVVFVQNRRLTSASAAEFKMSFTPTQIALGQKTSLELDYLNSNEEPLAQAKFLFKILRGLQVVSVEGGRWEPAKSLIEVGDIAPLSAGKITVALQSVALGKGEVFVDFVSADKNSRLFSQDKKGAFVDVLTPELKLMSQARYFSPEGEQLGRGPLPPKVGQTTKYQVYWTLPKSIVDLDEVAVEGTLAEGVEWDDFAPLGGESISYDALDQKVVWRAGKVYASVDLTGEKQPIPTVSFRLDFTPSISQIGKSAPLITNITLKGKEALAGVPLQGTSPDLTTDLIGDDLAKGKGVVER